MSTSIAQAIVPTTYDEQQLSLIKNTISKNLTNDEFSLLVEVAKRTGLDLFTRQLYGIKRGDAMTIQTGIDGYRLMAARTGDLAGIDDAVFDSEDADHPRKATVTVWRFVHSQRVPFTATARWAEYKQERSPMWGKMPFLMLGKCAEALALRKAFPAELSGIYTKEEMDQADEEPTPRPLPMKANHPTYTERPQIHTDPEQAIPTVVQSTNTRHTELQHRISEIEAAEWEKLDGYRRDLDVTDEDYAKAKKTYTTVAEMAAALQRLAERKRMEEVEQEPEVGEPQEQAAADEVAWKSLERRSLAAKLHKTKEGWEHLLETTGGSYEDTLVRVEQAEAQKGRH